MTFIRNQTEFDEGLAALVTRDPRLVPVAEAAGKVQLRRQSSGFPGLASIIVSQMISRASAQAIWNRMTASGPLEAQGYLAFNPETIATFGLSRAKARTLDLLARAVVEGRFDPDAVCLLNGREAVAAISSHPGIGPWTAEVYLMFCGGHADIFPSGDVALQASIAHAFALEARPVAKELEAMAHIWAPWRSVAAHLFWAYYAVRIRREVTPVVK